ncbi:MAG: hypothetical protein M1826_006499 [Phylliscum demangeonii]|nr:MAG: hypothetical protein M1826_006499 [Phylliscum demangeonii]
MDPEEPEEPEDPFDRLLHLEDDFYQEGYAQGMADGIAQGRLQGRALGTEHAFDKFLAIGRLHGRAAVLQARLRPPSADRTTRRPPRPADGGGRKAWTTAEPMAADGGPRVSHDGPDANAAAADGPDAPSVLGMGERERARSPPRLMPPLPRHARLEKHIFMLRRLTDLAQLPVENDDEAVARYEECWKQARGRAKLIEQMVHERWGDDDETAVAGEHGDKGKAGRILDEQNMEDFTNWRV